MAIATPKNENLFNNKGGSGVPKPPVSKPEITETPKFTYQKMHQAIMAGIISWDDVHNPGKGKDTFEFINPELYEAVKDKLNTLWDAPPKAEEKTTPTPPQPPETVRAQSSKKETPKEIPLKAEPPKPEQPRPPTPKHTPPAQTTPAVRNNIPSILRLSNGETVQILEKTFALKESENQLYRIKDKFSITAEGYFRLNQFANINLLKPTTVMVNGVEQGNPYYILNKESNAVDMVIIRKIAFGRAPTGGYAAIDQTLYYSPKAYFMRELMKLVEYPKVAVMRMASSLTEEEKTNCFFAEVTGGLGVLVLNVAHQDFLKIINSFAESQVMAGRRAETICERNCLKKHPSIGISSVKLIGQGYDTHADVTVHAFVETERTLNEIHHITQTLEKGQIGQLKNVEILQHIAQADEVEEPEVVADTNTEDKL